MIVMSPFCFLGWQYLHRSQNVYAPDVCPSTCTIDSVHPKLLQPRKQTKSYMHCNPLIKSLFLGPLLRSQLQSQFLNWSYNVSVLHICSVLSILHWQLTLILLGSKQTTFCLSSCLCHSSYPLWFTSELFQLCRTYHPSSFEKMQVGTKWSAAVVSRNAQNGGKGHITTSDMLTELRDKCLKICYSVLISSKDLYPMSFPAFSSGFRFSRPRDRSRQELSCRSCQNGNGRGHWPQPHIWWQRIRGKKQLTKKNKR